MKAKITLSNIYHYIVGNLRYRLYYSKYKYLIRSHILEQIDLRIKVMDKECYNMGSCKICGCKTTALQMADKACDKPCYPEMMNRYAWRLFKVFKTYKSDKSGLLWVWTKGSRGKDKLICKENKNGI